MPGEVIQVNRKHAEAAQHAKSKGAWAAALNWPRSANPYRENTMLHRRWKAGYDEEKFKAQS